MRSCLGVSAGLRASNICRGPVWERSRRGAAEDTWSGWWMPRRLVHTPPCAPAACAPLIESMNQFNERRDWVRASINTPPSFQNGNACSDEWYCMSRQMPASAVNWKIGFSKATGMYTECLTVGWLLAFCAGGCPPPAGGKSSALFCRCAKGLKSEAWERESDIFHW